MPSRTRARRVAGAVLIPLVLLLVACGSSSTAVLVGTPTATTAIARATVTASGSPPHAFAWTQHDGTGTAQVWASVNGATPVQITHTPAPGGGPCDAVLTYGPPVFAPDLVHVVAVAATASCGDGPITGTVMVITVASAAAAAVPPSGSIPQTARANMRAVGWVNATTLFYLWGGGLYTYTLGAPAATPVAGVANAEEAVVRGHILFYLRADTASFVNTLTLHRYDLSTSTEVPGPITMGQLRVCQCSPGDYALPGWDVSYDGAHIVYQHTTPRTDTNYGAASSQIMYADADGSHATPIAQALTGTTLLRMQLAPNGHTVAIDGVVDMAPVVTASTSSPGLAGDSNYHTYTPDATGFPVWKWDSSSFWAASQPSAAFSPPYTGSLGYYTVGSASATVGVAGGYNPWYTLP
jgi:hypothetical protein